MENFNMSTMNSYSHLLGSPTKIPMLIIDFYDQWVDHKDDYLNGIDEDLWKCIIGDVRPPIVVQSVGIDTNNPDVVEHAEKL